MNHSSGGNTVMSSASRREVVVSEESSSTTPIKRRRLLPLVDLRNPGYGSNTSYKERVSPSSEACHVMEFSGSASVGSGRRSRPALTDLTKSGFCGIVECGEPSESSKVSTLGSAKVLTKGISDPKDGTVSRFPRLDQCAHFHYEFVELPQIKVVLVNEDLKPLSQPVACEDTENKSLLVQVTSLGRSWVVRRTYDNFRFLDKQLHRCCYDRKISQLQELAPEENLPRGDEQNCLETLLEKYLDRLSHIAGSLITCGPVLGWLELDNRGHRLIVTDDSDINTPAVAAAYVVKRYTAQASDEISFEVGDMISVIDMPPPEESIWWRGKRGFQVGFFPCECVQVIEGKVPQGIHPYALALPAKRSGSNAHSHGSLHAVHSFSSAQEPMKPVLRKHGKLIAFFRSFILSRPPRPWLKRSGILRERVFGCDLAEHLLNSGHDIPMVLKCCAEFIETHGTVDGIYRLSGITSNIQKLRNAFDEERVPALYEDESILQDIHCVSSVLKMYFRELPNPLLTCQLYAKFSQAVVQEEGVRLLHVRDVVQQLPPPHYRTLEYLVRHLARVASFSNTTAMTPKNIAIVWAPNLLRSKDLERGGVAALQDVGTQAVVTEYLVRYVDLIFNDKIPNFSPSSLAARNRGDKLPRPKSLAISTPIRLLSIDEARNRSLAAIKSDQNYIDVGGGPNSLPKTYHTVIDIRHRKGGSLKQKKSPLGWKTFFWKHRNNQKHRIRESDDHNSNAAGVAGSFEGDQQPSKRLRSTKSVESLSSNGTPLHCTDNISVTAQDTNSLPFMEKERSTSSLSSPTQSPRTHSRSLSHDSYFNLLQKRLASCRSSKDCSHASPESELKELNIEFKLSESDVRIFSEDDTLQSTSMDTESRLTLDPEGTSLRSGISPSQRSRGPLKRNLLRSCSEDFKCGSLRPFVSAGPDYRSSGNLPKCAKLQNDRPAVGTDSNDIRSSEVASDKSPSRGSCDSALIEPDLLERITRLRASSTEETGSIGSLSDEPFPGVEELVFKPATPASIDDELFPLESSFADEVFQPPTEIAPSAVTPPPVEVEVHFELRSGQSSADIPSEPTSGFQPAMLSSIMSPDTPQSEHIFGDIQYHPLSDTTEPSTPSEKLAVINNSMIDTHSPNISCDSLSSHVVTSQTPDDDDTPVADDVNALISFPSEVAYEALCDSSPGDVDPQRKTFDPRYTTVDEAVYESPEESNYYENIDIRSGIESSQQPDYENCQFGEGPDITGSFAAAVADQSVYQQVKYLRRSIQEVNEILSADTEKNPPPAVERRKSITKMTIHFTKPSVPTNSSDNFKEPISPCSDHRTQPIVINETFPFAPITSLVQPSPTLDDLPIISEKRHGVAGANSAFSNKNSEIMNRPVCRDPVRTIKVPDESHIPVDASVLKPIVDLEPMPIGTLEYTHPIENVKPKPASIVEYIQPIGNLQSQCINFGQALPKDVVKPSEHIAFARSRLNNIMEPKKTIRTDGNSRPINIVEPTPRIENFAQPIDLVCDKPSHPIVVLRSRPINIVEPKEPYDTLSNSRSTETEEPSQPAKPFANISRIDVLGFSQQFEAKNPNITTSMKPVPLPRTTFDKCKSPVNRAQGSRSLTPPSPNTESFEHPSTSLPAALGRSSSHDPHRTKTWPLPPTGQHRNVLCCHGDESEKRERIEKYKEERRSFLRKNYHPSSFRGEKDEMLQRLKQKATCRSTQNDDTSPEDKFPIHSSILGHDSYTEESSHKLWVASSAPKHALNETKPFGSSKEEATSSEESYLEDSARKVSSASSSPPILKDASRRKPDMEEVTVRERVANWAQQAGQEAPKLKAITVKLQSSPIDIQSLKDRDASKSVHNNGVDNPHRPCIKSQSSDAIARSSPTFLPFKSEVASRRSSDAGRKLPSGGVVLKARKFSAFEPPKIQGSIGQDKIRAIAAQFEPEVKATVYLRQISK